jgi:hypothetical protein
MVIDKMMLNILLKLTITIIFYTMVIVSFPIHAQGNYFDLTFNGSYLNSYTSSYQYTKTSYGIDLGIPLNRYFELNLGESVSKETYIFTDDYKNYLISKGNSFPQGNLTQEYDSNDTYANLSLGLFSLYVSPSIYGGLMNREIYFRDYFGTVSTDTEKLTWDAGAALSIRLSRHLRFKVTYRISPSGVNSPYGNPYYDQSYWFGLTLSF